jgi:hypothetical protein
MDDGGGIENPFGVLVVTRCTISGNRAVDAGGGIRNIGALTRRKMAAAS